MKRFTHLYTSLNETNKTSGKVAAIADYFSRVGRDEDAAWGLFFLTGRRFRLGMPTKLLRAWATELGGVPEWLFAECHDAVGDLSETIALVLPPPSTESDRSLTAWVDTIQELRGAETAVQKRIICDAWSSLDLDGRYVWNKLLLGNFRVGASQQLVLRGLAQARGVEVTRLAERLIGEWRPSAEAFRSLVSDQAETAMHHRPYPFYLASPLETEPQVLGEVSEWQVEWKWDGIRAQVVRRGDRMVVWSRGEEILTERFPEFDTLVRLLPEGTVIDGEILPWQVGSDQPLSFAALQKRITRKSVTKSILREVPATILAYDLLEENGNDIRDLPLIERRRRLERLIGSILENPTSANGNSVLRVSPIVGATDWPPFGSLRQESRARATEGLMVKRLDSPYRAGRVRGDWWKWKIEPLTVDAVLTAAQRGSGKRASLYTDYTFCVWDQGRLVPFAKAYSGLTDAEIREVDDFVRKNMREKFGPVRTVEPLLVFELAFEAIQRSTRHKSGVAVRFPRILRWRRDKTADQADSLETIAALIPGTATTHNSTTGNTSREPTLFDR